MAEHPALQVLRDRAVKSLRKALQNPDGDGWLEEAIDDIESLCFLVSRESKRKKGKTEGVTQGPEREHEFNVFIDEFEAIESGDKTFFAHPDARNVRLADVLVLRERKAETHEGTGRVLRRRVIYIQGHALGSEYIAVMALGKIPSSTSEWAEVRNFLRIWREHDRQDLTGDNPALLDSRCRIVQDALQGHLRKLEIPRAKLDDLLARWTFGASTDYVAGSLGIELIEEKNDD